MREQPMSSFSPSPAQCIRNERPNFEFIFGTRRRYDAFHHLLKRTRDRRAENRAPPGRRAGGYRTGEMPVGREQDVQEARVFEDGELRFKVSSDASGVPPAAGGPSCIS